MAWLVARVTALVAIVPLKLRLSLALMASFSTQSLLITASKRQGTDFGYEANSVVLLSEAIKLAFAVLMVTRKGQWAQVKAQPFRVSLCFSIPGLLYSLQNNLVFRALGHLTPGLYQLFNNFKIVTTALVFRLIIRRPLKMIQWIALTLLVLGMSVTADLRQAIDVQAPVPGKVEDDAAEPSIVAGLTIMFIMSVCSALASVSNEVLIKRSTSVYTANIWLYGYGVLGCAAYTVCTSGPGGLLPERLLAGFTKLTWAVALCSAFMGQCIAYIFRYGDVIVKTYAAAATVAFTAAASWVFFGIEPTASLVAGYLICVCSICLYYLDAELLLSTDTEVGQMCCGKVSRSE